MRINATDGWYPLLQWPYVLLGNTWVTVVDLRTNEAVLSTNGFPAGWYGEGVIAFTRMAGIVERELFIQPLGGEAKKLHGPTFMGNHPVVSEGHAYWTTGDALYVDGLLAYHAPFAVNAPTVGTDGWVTVRQEERIWTMKDGTLRAIYVPQTDNAHKVLPGPQASASYGYWGRVAFIDNDGEVDATVWEPEGPASILWAEDDYWTVRAVEHPELGMGVISGPLGDPKVVQIWGMPSVHLHAQLVEDMVKIVGNDAQGKAFFLEHTLSSDRTEIGQEPDMALQKPGVQVTAFSETLTNGEASSFEFYDRNNPDLGIKVKIELVPTGVGVWSWHATMTNAAGSNRSGKQRDMALTGSGGGGEPPPPSGDKYLWRGNFLAFPGFEMAFMFPAWSAEKQQAFLRAYREAGHTHLPLSPWASYGGLSYDYSGDPAAFNALIEHLQSEGLQVCVMCFTDAFEPHHPRTFADAESWARWYLPQLPAIRLAATGWEFNQININSPSYWCGDGTKHIAWARVLRQVLPADVPLYVHFSPERITGWPNYPNHDGPQDEQGWWDAAAPYVDGLLYQRRPNEEVRYTLAHTIGGKAEDGSVDVGDAKRIAGNYWGVKKRFVVFEHSRTLDRWKEIIDGVKSDPLIDGWC